MDRSIAFFAPPDLWDLSDVEGEVRDESGLLVCTCPSDEAAETMIHDRREHRQLWMEHRYPDYRRPWLEIGAPRWPIRGWPSHLSYAIGIIAGAILVWTSGACH